MATKPNTAPVAAKAPAFTYENIASVPEAKRVGGGEPSPYTAAITALNAPASATGPFHSFLIPVTVPASITDPTERGKAQREGARKTMNRVSGIARRVMKLHPDRKIVTRSVNDGAAVRVIRTFPTPATA